MDGNEPREMTWRERTDRDKLIEKARKMLQRQKRAEYEQLTPYQRRTLHPSPGSVVEVAGTSYIVQSTGEYRKVKPDA